MLIITRYKNIQFLHLEGKIKITFFPYLLQKRGLYKGECYIEAVGFEKTEHLRGQPVGLIRTEKPCIIDVRRHTKCENSRKFQNRFETASRNS